MLRASPFLPWVLWCLCLAAAPLSARAQEDEPSSGETPDSAVRPVPLGDFSSLRFAPAASTSSYLSVEGARIQGHLNMAVGLSVDYAHRPLVIYGAECDETGRRCEATGARSDLVSMTGAVFAYGALTLFDAFEVSMMVPMVYSRGESFLGEPDLQGRRVTRVGGSSLGPGDLQIGVK